jgi:hypothetical protein
LDVQKAAALAILERRAALEKAIHGNSTTTTASDEDEEDTFHDAREQLETSFSTAKAALANGRPEDVPAILHNDALLPQGLVQPGENVMQKVTKLFETMEREAKAGNVSEGARIVLDALATTKPTDCGIDGANEAVLEALTKALSLEEDGKWGS